MATYSKVQFIAFNIKPSYKDEKTKPCLCGCPQFTAFTDPKYQQYCQDCWNTYTQQKCNGNHKSYLGDKDPTKDIEYRCTLMKKAIETAFHDANVLKAKVRRHSWNIFSKKELVLKVFMAPEFYFRGAEGAYPSEQIHTIMENMREETNSKSYKDWLFIFGTAIGYMKHEETSVKITSVERIPGNKTKITVDSLLESDWTSASASEYVQFKDCSDASKSPVSGPATVTRHTKGIQATIKDIHPETGDRFNITLDTKEPCPVGNYVFFYRKGFTQTKRFEIMGSKKDASGSTIITIENPSQNRHKSCPECEDTNKCGKFETLPTNLDLCRNCSHTHSNDSKNYIRMNQVAKMESTLVLNTNTGFEVDHFLKLAAAEKKTEIGNYALVCKGGLKRDDTDEPKQFVIYKEYISSIDFLRDIKKDWGKSAGRLIEIHGQEDRVVLPTEGSRDLLSAKKNIPGTTTTYIDKDGKKKEHRISEINKVGYGGGSVFTIDDITFGLEVCLDHAYNRIWEFYNGSQAKAGDPKVQIHLIPSWGMSIAGGKICCVDKGLVFNVDGERSDSEVRIMEKNKEYCCTEPHDIQSKPGVCLKCKTYYCTTCGKYYPPAINCGCGTPLSKVYHCPEHEERSLSQDDCSVCKKKKVLYEVKLQPIGTLVKSKGSNVGVTHPRINEYFEKDGQIKVYEKKPIPKAQTV